MSFKIGERITQTSKNLKKIQQYQTYPNRNIERSSLNRKEGRICRGGKITAEK